MAHVWIGSRGAVQDPKTGTSNVYIGSRGLFQSAASDAEGQTLSFAGSLGLSSTFQVDNPNEADFSGALALASAFVIDNQNAAAFAGNLALASAFAVDNKHHASFAGSLALTSAFTVSNSFEAEFAGALGVSSSFQVDNANLAEFSGAIGVSASFDVDNPPLVEFSGALGLASDFELLNEQRFRFSGNVTLAAGFEIDNQNEANFAGNLAITSAFVADTPPLLEFGGNIALGATFAIENQPLLEFSGDISLASSFSAEVEPSLEFSAALAVASGFQIGAIPVEFSANLTISSAMQLVSEEIEVSYANTYSRSKDFSEEGGAATDHANLNAELDAIGSILNTVNSNLQQIMRQDNILGNEAVHPRAFDTGSLALMASGTWTIRGAWATATEYAVSDLVEEDGNSYVAAIAHTAGVFATDVAAGNWLPVSPESVSTAEAQTLIDASMQGTRANWAAGAGSGNTITANLTPTLTAYTDGMRVTIRSPGANSVTAPTINIDGLGARSITKLGNRALVAGDIDQAGHELLLCYRAGSSTFDLLNPAVRVAGTIGHTIMQAADGAAVRSAIAAPGTGVDNTFTKRNTYAYNTIASAAELDLSGADGNYLSVTGGTGITSISAHGVGTPITLVFAGSLLLTHHATNLILPTGANITTKAGDTAVMLEYATGDWRCIGFTRADGKPLGSGNPAGSMLMHGGLGTPAGGYIMAYGQAVSRATYPDMLEGLTLLTDGDVTNGSGVITNIPDTGELYAGMAMEGASFATGTTISSVDSATQVTVSNNWSGTTGSDEAIRFLPHGQGDGSTTFNTPDMRDRVPVGRGNMGGSAAGRLISSIAAGVGKVFGSHNGSFGSNITSHAGGGTCLTAASSNGVVQPSIAFNWWVKT